MRLPRGNAKRTRDQQCLPAPSCTEERTLELRHSGTPHAHSFHSTAGKAAHGLDTEDTKEGHLVPL